VRDLGAQLEAAGLPVYEPVGGHAVYVQPGELLDHLAPEAVPGQSLVCALYEEGGVRAVKLGGFAFPAAERPAFVRLAILRRRYHREHFEHVGEAAAAVADHADTLPVYEVVAEPPMTELRHSSAELRPLQ
jgi:tryptophanase